MLREDGADSYWPGGDTIQARRKLWGACGVPKSLLLRAWGKVASNRQVSTCRDRLGLAGCPKRRLCC